MSDVNSYVVGGRLTRDAELRFTEGGTAVTDVTIASNRVWSKQAERQEETTFMDVTIWGKQAETLCNYLQKGSHIIVTGRIKQEKWEDKDGNKRSRHTVVAEQVSLSPKNTASGPIKDNKRVEEKVDFDSEVPF